MPYPDSVPGIRSAPLPIVSYTITLNPPDEDWRDVDYDAALDALKRLKLLCKIGDAVTTLLAAYPATDGVKVAVEVQS